eukprot:1159031-Pelagomonas_calceolata.AAC.8
MRNTPMSIKQTFAVDINAAPMLSPLLPGASARVVPGAQGSHLCWAACPDLHCTIAVTIGIKA